MSETTQESFGSSTRRRDRARDGDTEGSVSNGIDHKGLHIALTPQRLLWLVLAISILSGGGGNAAVNVAGRLLGVAPPTATDVAAAAQAASASATQVQSDIAALKSQLTQLSVERVQLLSAIETRLAAIERKLGLRSDDSDSAGAAPPLALRP